MKAYLRIVVLFLLVGAVMLVLSLFRRAGAPESSIIGREKSRMETSIDNSRMEKDPIYASEYHDKLRFLDYRLAVAYNTENKPEAAIAILQKLIDDEEAQSKTPHRRSRSFVNEALYYEAMENSYALKQDRARAEKAAERRKELMAGAEEAKKRERREEGRSVALPAE